MKNRILIAILFLVVVALVGASSLLARRGDRSAGNGNTALLENAVQPTETVGTTNLPVYQLPDADRDGLSDEEEGRLGTNPADSDTDGDGLYDREEVAYQTDPQKADTDGDGFRDGPEVQGNFNPKGPGPLLDLKSSVNALTNS